MTPLVALSPTHHCALVYYCCYCKLPQTQWLITKLLADSPWRPKMGLTGKLRCWQGWVLWRIWGRVPFLAFSASRGCLHSLAPASFPAAPASLAPRHPPSLTLLTLLFLIRTLVVMFGPCGQSRTHPPISGPFAESHLQSLLLPHEENVHRSRGI